MACLLITLAFNGVTFASASELSIPTLSWEESQNDFKVTGVVRDASGEPIIGASVKVVDETIGTVTDIDGKFTLNLPSSGKSLSFTYIGYSPVTIKANKAEINVVMEEDSKLLNEVVVVGYGIQKKENLTGAVSSVDVGKTLSSRPIADVGRGLQGSTPGLTITLPTGEIGSDPVMKIRGQVGSVSGTNNPLILLDNVEIPSIQMVNPDDIASISVLKDAASAMIYGSKAAFGVILITTKKGAKEESVQVNYSNNFSWQNPAKSIDMAGSNGIRYTLDSQINRDSPMPAGGFWRVNEESYQGILDWQQKYGNSVKWNSPVLYGRDWTYDATAGNKYGYRLYDASKAMIDNWTPSMTHNLSVSGKKGETTYSIGLGYLDQSGMSKTAREDKFTRYNASMSISTQVHKQVSVRASSIYSDRNKKYPGVGTSADPWLYLYRWSPLFPIGVTENGNPLRDPSYEMSQANTDNLQNRYMSVSVGATVDITPNWDVQFDYTYNRSSQEKNSSVRSYTSASTWYSASPLLTTGGDPVYVNGEGQVVDTGGIPAYTFPLDTYYSGATVSSLTKYKKDTDNNVFNVYSTYNWRMDDKNALKAMIGINSVSSKWTDSTTGMTGLIDQSNPQFNLSSGSMNAGGGANMESQFGTFGRLNYNYDEKYLLEANLRRDGTSKFPKDLRWQWFSGFSGGWIFTGEKFAKPIEPILSFGKFRASWGSVGDQQVSNSLYRSSLSSYMPTGTSTNWIGSDGKVVVGFGTPSLVDGNISWQRVENLDLGVDLRFFKNKLGVTFDWYQRDTKNMIIEGESLPVTLGAFVPKGNYGDLRTRGWEIAVDFNHKFSNGISVNATLSLADATTVVTKGSDDNLPWELRNLNTKYSSGRRFGDIYGYVTDRLFQKDDFVYKANGEIEKVNIYYNGATYTTYKQSSKNPVYQVEFENNDKLMFAPGDVKFVDVDGDGYISSGDNTNGNPGDQVVIGNSTPRYEYGIRLGANYKGFDVSIFMQGIGKRKIWGSGQLAIPGYNAKEGAMPSTFADDYWTESNTGAFYPRAWDLGGSDTGFSMQRQSKYLLNMAYFRVKNITLGYSLPSPLLTKAFIKNARIYVSLENFFTKDNLRGLPIDPEAVSGYSMFEGTYNLGRTGVGTPVFKSGSCGVQITF